MNALRVFLAAALVFAGAAAPCVTPAYAQIEEDLTEGLKEIREAYERARMLSDDLDFRGTVVEVDSVIRPRAGATTSSLSLEEIRILSAAYDFRARAYVNLGDVQAAEADFEALLSLAPAFRIDRESLSPKVVELFDKVRVGLRIEVSRRVRRGCGHFGNGSDSTGQRPRK